MHIQPQLHIRLHTQWCSSFHPARHRIRNHPGDMVNHPLIPLLERHHTVLGTDGLNQVGGLKHISMLLPPTGRPSAVTAGVWKCVDKTEFRVGLTKLQHDLPRPDVHTPCHPGDEGSISIIDGFEDCLLEALLDFFFHPLQLFRPMACEAAAVKAQFLLIHYSKHKPKLPYFQHSPHRANWIVFHLLISELNQLIIIT